MSAASDVTTLADVLASESKGGQIVVNVGDKVDGSGVSSDSPLWANADGFISRPNDPDAAGAAQALYVNEGPTTRIIAIRDNRWIGKVGNLAPGDRAIVSNCDARLFLKRSNNGITIYTANDTDSGSAMIVDVNGAQGKLTLMNGQAVVTIEKDKILLSAGGTALVIDAQGVNVFGSHFGANTSTGTLGAGGVPVMVGPPPGAPSASWQCTP